MNTNTFSFEGSTYEGIGLKYLHSQVLRLLKTAAIYQGKAYGGYVRDVISRVRCNDFFATKVKDLDIWFKTEKDRNEFISNCNEDILVKTGYNESQEKVLFSSDGLGVIQYLLKDDFGDNLILVDLVVCPVFPVWDLSVNFILYDYDRDNLISIGYNGLTDTLNNIRKRKAILSYEAENVIRYKKNTTVSIQGHELKIDPNGFSRRIEKFIKNGWLIETKDGETVYFDDYKLTISQVRL
jgi:hypothetical protein